MNKKKITFNFYFITIFFVLQMLFVGVTLLLDLTFKVNFPFYIFHFLVIAINFVFFIIFLLVNKIILEPKNPLFFIGLGLFFTVIADIGLVLIAPENKEGFVLAFVFAQMSYFFYMNIYRKTDLTLTITGLIIGGLLLLFMVRYLVGMELPLLYIVCGVYGVLFIVNIVCAIIYKYRKIYLIGLILYLICDIMVVLSYFLPDITVFSDLIFLFYLPGQVLITYYGLNELFKEFLLHEKNDSTIEK